MKTQNSNQGRYTVERYRDHKTGRTGWGVFSWRTGEWYIADKDTRKAHVALAKTLNEVEQQREVKP